MFDTSFELKCGKCFTQVQEIASKKVAVLYFCSSRFLVMLLFLGAMNKKHPGKLTAGTCFPGNLIYMIRSKLMRVWGKRWPQLNPGWDCYVLKKMETNLLCCGCNQRLQNLQNKTS